MISTVVQDVNDNGVTLKIVEVVSSAGLQIKADPGIPIRLHWLYLADAGRRYEAMFPRFGRCKGWSSVRRRQEPAGRR